jgi:hypothetical protein
MQTEFFKTIDNCNNIINDLLEKMKDSCAVQPEKLNDTQSENTDVIFP